MFIILRRASLFIVYSSVPTLRLFLTKRRTMYSIYAPHAGFFEINTYHLYYAAWAYQHLCSPPSVFVSFLYKILWPTWLRTENTKSTKIHIVRPHNASVLCMFCLFCFVSLRYSSVCLLAHRPTLLLFIESIYIVGLLSLYHYSIVILFSLA